MRITRTIRADSRAEITALVRGLREGCRVTLEDPEATDAQKVRLRIMLGELARRVEWHGEKLTATDWKTMTLAAIRSSHVVHGFTPGTRVVLFERRGDEPSVQEASEAIEFLYQFCAERGITLSGRS